MQQGVDWESVKSVMPFIRGCVWQVWLTVQTALRKNTHQHLTLTKRLKCTPRHVLNTVCQTSEKTNALAARYKSRGTEFLLGCSMTRKIQAGKKLCFLWLTNFSLVNHVQQAGVGGTMTPSPVWQWSTLWIAQYHLYLYKNLIIHGLPYLCNLFYFNVSILCLFHLHYFSFQEKHTHPHAPVCLKKKRKKEKIRPYSERFFFY